MKKGIFLIISLVVVVCSAPSAARESKPAGTVTTPQAQGYAGSQSCRECHEKFYQLWSTSRHGLAMQPYTAEFARAQLSLQQKDVAIGKTRYRAEVGKGQGWVTETGPAGKKKYPIVHVLGGKNVYYFLTPFDRGRLQTLARGLRCPQERMVRHGRQRHPPLPGRGCGRAGRAGRILPTPSIPPATAAT